MHIENVVAIKDGGLGVQDLQEKVKSPYANCFEVIDPKQVGLLLTVVEPM